MAEQSPPVTSSVNLRCRYFVFAKGRDKPVEWRPPDWDESLPVDCRYFGLALAEMDRIIAERGASSPLHVYVTWDWRELPEYGNHVVVLLLGEELGLVPRYVRHVHAVFKTMRLRPTFGSSWRGLGWLEVLLYMKLARNWLRHLQSRWKAWLVPRHWPAQLRKTIEVLDVPLGYYRQVAVPQLTMSQRPFHCFFAGEMVAPASTLAHHFLPTPKQFARRKMLLMIHKLRQREPRFRYDGGDFGGSALSPDEYSRRLMNSKICLAPRGSVPDTFRFFEGLRAGCLVVCEKLTSEWFYAGAPVIQLADWNAFPRLLAPYLEDDEALEQARSRSLEWWEKNCSETAVGRAMADYLIKR